MGEMEQSGLKEVGNIVCSAYLTALSNFMGMMLLPSVPTLTTGSTNAAIASSVDPHELGSDLVFCVDTAFRAEGSEALSRGLRAGGSGRSSLDRV